MFEACVDLNSGAHQRPPVIWQFAAAIPTEQWDHFYNRLNLNSEKKERERNPGERNF